MRLRIATTITFCQLVLTDAREVVVVQLKLLGLTIPVESGIVQLDAMMRADLIEQCYGFAVRMLDGGSTSAAIAIPA